MKKSRVEYTILNSTYSVATQLVRALLTFASRTVFISTLGLTYLSLNGLLTSVLSMLSLAELGIGAAMSYALYKPLADENYPKIGAYMQIFERLYRLIGILVLILGILVSFFLSFIIKDQSITLEIRLIYFLFLINSVISYFFVYKRTLIEADQRKYLIIVADFLVFVVGTVLQIGFLIYTKNYYIYLVLAILMTVISNIIVSRIVDKHYPYIHSKEISPITTSERASFIRNIKGMMVSKLGDVVVFGTDNILMSSFISLSIVGLYSNYSYLLAILSGFINMMGVSVRSSIANLVHSDGTSKAQEETFIRRYQFILFAIVFFMSVGVTLFINPLITLWIGPEYLFDLGVVFLIGVYFFIKSYRSIFISLVSVYGVYFEQNLKTIVEAILNIVFSIGLLVTTDLGIIAILVGTILSSILTSVWYEPYSIFKYGLGVPFWPNFKRVLIHYGLMLTTLIILCLTQFYLLESQTVWMGIFYRIVIFIALLVGFTIAFYGHEDLEYVGVLLKRAIRRTKSE